MTLQVYDRNKRRFVTKAATAITLDGLESIPSNTVLGRISEGVGSVEVLTRDQLLTLLAILGVDGKLLTSLMPELAITRVFAVASESAMLALDAQLGDMAIRSDSSKTFVLSTNSPTILADWLELKSPSGGVTSVAGRTGVITLSSEDIGGLGNAATKNVGATANTVAAGNDPRFSSSVGIISITTISYFDDSGLTSGLLPLVGGVPYNRNVTGWEVFSTDNISGSLVIDIWSDTYTNFPPTAADSIMGSQKPTISSSTKGQDLSLSPQILMTANNNFKINIDSVSGLKGFTLLLYTVGV